MAQNAGITGFQGFWRSYSRNSMGLVGLGMMGLILVIAIAAPVIAPYDPEEVIQVTIADLYAKPSAQHWLGTDDAGKDVLTNWIYGTRVSLIVGFFASFISIVIGGVIALLTVWAASVRIGGMNVIRAIRDLPDARAHNRRPRTLLWSALGVVAGGALLAVGVTGDRWYGVLFGTPIVALAAVPLLTRSLRQKTAITIAARPQQRQGSVWSHVT